MKFMNPACLINKLGRSHSKKSYERLVREDDQVERSKKKHGSAPKGSIDLFVGKEEKKYPVPLKYFTHPKLQELLKEYQEPVFDPRFDEPIVLECSTEIFEQLLRYIVKTR
ncbi:auxin-responsive protein SAUR50-like [Rosa chinensis]|uniref:auxin-responsive protein SAUR50-like n=1 Tax=Rosa chinensis TaxID=74649 RepID=UPI000D094119|nr:auxin-responsive protein SAUR50-like [Rosa chinensis]